LDIPTREDLTRLATSGTAPRVSLYMPTHRAGPDTRQDPIRLKNLLTESEEKLTEYGMRRTEAKDLLAPAWSLQDDYDFWKYQSSGLAIFMEEHFMRYYRVPVQLPELAVVTSRFHVKPLLPLFANDTLFYVLAISMNKTRVLECTPYDEDEVKVPDMPSSMADALWADDTEKQVQFRSFFAGTGGNVAMFHGAGGSEDDPKNEILRYFREVDRALSAHLRDAHGPLVLAAVDYLLPIYRDANTYANLFEDNVSGSPDEARSDELREKAWTLLEPRIAETREREAGKYREMLGTGRASNRVDEVAVAAANGRVETSFVPIGVQIWGRFDAETNSAELHDEPQTGDQDMLDFIAVQTRLNSGRVYALQPEDMPDPDGQIAAVFRY
jgi:hypothetical protein